MTGRLLVSVSVAALGFVVGYLPPAYAQEVDNTDVPAAVEAAPDAAAGATPTTGDAPSSATDLPEVEAIQRRSQTPAPAAAAPKPKPRPAAAAAKPRPRPAAAAAKPKPQPQPTYSPEPLPPAPIDDFADAPPAEPILNNSPYGAANSAGAAARAQQSAQTPINGKQLIPDNLEGFSSAASRLSKAQLEENQPRNVNEALTRVPGVIVINDDANAHHGGIGLRGSPARRSRKLLVMEDGHSVNLALWIDPSVHYWGPIERFESVEVLRGTIVTHGPNNNFGVINARNLSPFGPDETVVSAAIGFTKSKAGAFQPREDDGSPDGPPVRGKSDIDTSLRWHTHTRQSSDNFGIVLSYTGGNVQGVWDTERLRFNDFYGALGWKGTDQDLVVSVMHARQKDNYDEQNFLTEYELEGNFASEDAAEDAAEALAEANRGGSERDFFRLGHCKTCFAPASGLNNYNGEIWRGQIVHNYNVDLDTTVTARIYGGYHRRDRFQLIDFDSDPRSADPNNVGAAPVLNDDGDGYIFGEDTMFGRLRTFRHAGSEVRTEFANREILGFKQDIQAGVRYEYSDMTNRNFLGLNGHTLHDGDDGRATLFDRSIKVNAVSAFLQTNIAVAKNFNVLPGVRFEYYDVKRTNRVIAEEESEAGGADDCAALEAANPGSSFGGDCLDIDGINFNPANPSEKYDTFNVLPGVSFAYTGLYRTTLYGGYHRGLSTNVLRNETFPAADEIGDNFNIGIRSSAFKGFDFEVAGFYQIIENYQFGASFSDGGDRDFGRAEEATIKGVELAGRLNSQPFTGGNYNFFAGANYTYAQGRFTGNIIGADPGDDSIKGNDLPEVPFHVAALTLGVEKKTGWRWDASVTWTYRGSFFTDEGNTPYGVYEAECDGPGGPGDYECEVEEAGEDGRVPSVWLLSARFNMDIGDTGASVFVAGDNLLDELYISDREDGLKPGLGRTIWTGFKYKF